LKQKSLGGSPPLGRARKNKVCGGKSGENRAEEGQSIVEKKKKILGGKPQVPTTDRKNDFVLTWDQ